MNSLKRVAQISAIVCGIALLATIIMTPFTVSSVINIYNNMVDKATAESDQYTIVTDLDPNTKQLIINTERDRYSFINICVVESPDENIHILTKDIGFEKYVPEILYRDGSAVLGFRWKSDGKLSEENVLQALYHTLEGYYYKCIIQLPASAFLSIEGENMADLYRWMDVQFKGFANYEEFQASYENFEKTIVKQEAYNNYRNTISGQLQHINNLRMNISNNTDSYSSEDFLSFTATQYAEIKELRSNMLKSSYNFRTEYSLQDNESISNIYLEMQKMISELCAQEQEYDLLSVQQNIARERFNNGEINEESFSKTINEAFDRQVELDLNISNLRQKFFDYLHEDFLEEQNSDPEADLEEIRSDDHSSPEVIITTNSTLN